LYNVSHETALLELQHSELQASVEIIDAALGGKCQTAQVCGVTKLEPLNSCGRRSVDAFSAWTQPRFRLPTFVRTSSKARALSRRRPAQSALVASGVKV
jgi:hypothetical protein